MRLVTLLGAVQARRDALAAALALHAANANPPCHITAQLGGDVTLLLGLSRSDALSDSAAHLADQSLRRQLNDAQLPYQVLYGTLSEQLAQAVRILNVHQPASPSAALPKVTSNWRWACDKCSDPACEHKLLTDLLAQRKPAT